MEIITGYTGKKHITSEQDRDINIGIVGGKSYVLCTGMQLEAEVSTNNEIKIRDGVIMHQGCAASIKKNTYDSVTIVNGSQGMKRIDLIVARYQRNRDTNVESLNLHVIQGTPKESNPAVPNHTVGDIQGGDLIADMPLYQVTRNGLNITEVKKVFEIMDDLETVKKEVAELNRKWYADGYVLVNIDSLPNSGKKTVAVTLPSNVTQFWIESAWATSPANTIRYPLPYIDAGVWSNAISIIINSSKQIEVSTTANWSGYPAYAIVAYKL